MLIVIPNNSLVVMIGISGSGKSTFARKYFSPTQIVSSDFCRALICDDENDQTVNNDAFELLHLLLAKRLALRKLTVVDATNVKATSRQPLLDLAKTYDVPAIAIVFNFELEFCLQQNSQRTHRVVPPEILTEQFQELQTSIPMLSDEGFQKVYVLSSVIEIQVSVESMESVES